jgi:hypothetical protein
MPQPSPEYFSKSRRFIEWSIIVTYLT